MWREVKKLLENYQVREKIAKLSILTVTKSHSNDLRKIDSFGSVKKEKKDFYSLNCASIRTAGKLL